MKKKLVAALLIGSMVMASMTGCGNTSEEAATTAQTVAESASLLAASVETTEVSTEETSEAESSTEEKSGIEYATDKEFVLNTVDEDGNPCDVQTSLNYAVEDDGAGKKTYTIDLTYTQENQKPFLVKVTAFDTEKLNIIKKFDDADGDTAEGEIKTDDSTYNYSAVVNKETDDNGVVTKETLTLTVDSEYDNLGLWIVAYEDKTHLGDERRYEIK